MHSSGYHTGSARPSPAFSAATTDSTPAKPAMLFDGKRMRIVWQLEDGNGDSTERVIKRCKNTMTGHPTWKLFVEDVTQPIIRGSNDEPPRCVYLEDKACHAVWNSGLYTNLELNKFWPFDFDHEGNIRTARPHRGRPAYVKDSSNEIAKGKLRGKGAWYEFTGGPDTPEDKPVRQQNTGLELEVEAEPVAQNESAGAGAVGTPLVMRPDGTPYVNSDEIYPCSPFSRTIRIKKTPDLRSSPFKNPSKPPHKPKPPMTQISKDEVQRKSIPLSRSSRGPSDNDTPSRVDTSDSKAFASKPQLVPTTPAQKRKPVGPFLTSSNPANESPKSPRHKRAKVGGQKSSILAEPSQQAVNDQPGEAQASQVDSRSSITFQQNGTTSDEESITSSDEEKLLGNAEEMFKRGSSSR